MEVRNCVIRILSIFNYNTFLISWIFRNHIVSKYCKYSSLEKIQRILLIWNTIEHQAQVYHLWIVFLSFSSNYINYVQPQRPDFIYIASFDFRLSQKWDRHLVNLMMRILYFRREFCKFSLLKKWKKNTSRIKDHPVLFIRILSSHKITYFKDK